MKEGGKEGKVIVGVIIHLHIDGVEARGSSRFTVIAALKATCTIFTHVLFIFLPSSHNGRDSTELIPAIERRK